MAPGGWQADPVDPKARVLVVDDEANARTALADLLREEGYQVDTAADGFKALPKLEEMAPDVLLTDLRMPGMAGLELLERSRTEDPERVVIVMTAHGAVDTAVAAMRAGAADYLQKPLNFDELLLVLARELERQRLRAEAGSLRARLAERHALKNMVGSSAPMQAVTDIVLQVAPSRASVLITGESGTGKELVAAAIHQYSPRADKPFVKLHCAALAETLLESELFGHERGSFTGAVGRHDGRFMEAHGGTLFLDEIGEISPSVQVKLLRFLQEHEFQRVGSGQTIKVDVRVVAATNRDLMEQIKAGKFREDLYYRLNVVSIEMPALRERPSDIPLLAMHFLRKYSRENDKQLTGFDDAALARLAHYNWPGNVRELENAIERAVVLARGDVVAEKDLAANIVPTKGGLGPGAPVIPGASMADIERFAILKTLESTGGSTTRAATVLGISPRTIQYRLQQYQGKPPTGENDPK
ncbi:MAG: sigma-54-dependent Fis family transcriptional regulator [Deltaproteobacteria bacterium]|nr:sigma-54-dependent Fis family transcriptional regulator [Deltaproteobacteria bacterium]